MPLLFSYISSSYVLCSFGVPFFLIFTYDSFMLNLSYSECYFKTDYLNVRLICECTLLFQNLFLHRYLSVRLIHNIIFRVWFQNTASVYKDKHFCKSRIFSFACSRSPCLCSLNRKNAFVWVLVDLRNITLSSCLHSLVKPRRIFGRIWEQISEISKTQLKVFTCSRILTIFAEVFTKLWWHG